MTRIADQDPAFLRFIEKNDLKPGQPVEVETRDAAADSVLLHGEVQRRITIGARAASKLLVEIASDARADPALTESDPGLQKAPEKLPGVDPGYNYG